MSAQDGWQWNKNRHEETTRSIQKHRPGASNSTFRFGRLRPSCAWEWWRSRALGKRIKETHVRANLVEFTDVIARCIGHGKELLYDVRIFHGNIGRFTKIGVEANEKRVVEPDTIGRRDVTARSKRMKPLGFFRSR